MESSKDFAPAVLTPSNSDNTVDHEAQPPLHPGLGSTRSSKRVRAPTQRLLWSKKSKELESEARRAGQDWAGGWKKPKNPKEVNPSIDPLPEDVEEDTPGAFIAQIPEPENTWVPRNYEEARSWLDLWGGPMDKEMDQLDGRKAFTPMPLLPGQELVPVMWVYSVSFDGEGKLKKRKARLVVKGFKQIQGTHYFESWAMVTWYESIRFLAAVGAQLRLRLWTADFTGAYLNTKPQGTNFLCIPPGYEKRYSLRDGTTTALLMNINIYSTMDTGNNWYKLLDKSYRSLGHTPLAADPCVRSRIHVNSGSTITATYTDDVFGLSTDDEEMKETTEEIGDLYKWMVSPELDAYLGITIKQDKMSGDISLQQQVLIDKIVKRFGDEGGTRKFTPLPTSLDLEDSQPSPIPVEDIRYMRGKDYMSLIGSLNHVAQGTRPDIAFAVALLQQYCNDPRSVHWDSALHIMAYLNTTRNYRLSYRGGGGSLKPLGYTDASHGDIKEESGVATRKTTLGYVFIISGGAVSWSLTKMRRVATSTTEAEMGAMVHAGKQAIWMWKFLDGLKMEQELPFEIHVDNMPVLELTGATTKHTHTKHFDYNWAWIRDSVRERELNYTYIRSSDNIADLFTKTLPRFATERFAKILGLVNE